MSKFDEQLARLNLEDSYFLGLYVTGKRLRLRGLFALAGDHPSYRPIQPGEKHCYREGDVVVDDFRMVAWKALSPHLLFDPDGTPDLGSFRLAAGDGVYRVDTEWFAASFTAEAVSIELCDER